MAALVAGALNSVAGGGSFISFPALLFVGIAPIAANATNTVALLPGGIASTVAYRNSFTAVARRLLPPLLVTAIVGGVLGAWIMLRTPPATFLHLIPWLLLAATLLFVVSGRVTAWVRVRVERVEGGAYRKGSTPPLLLAVGLLLQLMIATYVGYFGAGTGILMLALLALLGMENIHAMNGLKTLLMSICNGVAAVTYIYARVVAWPQALLMVVGAVAGGYGGAYFAQKMSPQLVRWIVIAVGFGMSAYFFIRY
ncbi:MAG TPA: sulfite exporter TauE/SafE family protein [Candidatus Acidoferrales bacterium]|nr:sulfite exporter TauE/SafE family protein [Candidatus Acidoferrales bacterium]